MTPAEKQDYIDSLLSRTMESLSPSEKLVLDMNTTNKALKRALDMSKIPDLKKEPDYKKGEIFRMLEASDVPVLTDKVELRQVSCGSCYFWKETTEHRGQCRKIAPEAYGRTGANSYSSVSIWPATDDIDWCGDHKLA